MFTAEVLETFLHPEEDRTSITYRKWPIEDFLKKSNDRDFGVWEQCMFNPRAYIKYYVAKRWLSNLSPKLRQMVNDAEAKGDDHIIMAESDLALFLSVLHPTFNQFYTLHMTRVYQGVKCLEMSVRFGIPILRLLTERMIERCDFGRSNTDDLMRLLSAMRKAGTAVRLQVPLVRTILKRRFEFYGNHQPGPLFAPLTQELKSGGFQHSLVKSEEEGTSCLCRSSKLNKKGVVEWRYCSTCEQHVCGKCSRELCGTRLAAFLTESPEMNMVVVGPW